MVTLGGEEMTDFGRLVLGFDAGCLKCSQLARRIQEQVNGKLEIRSLRDSQVREWREKALGGDAPWAPTLIEVKGSEVRAWSGWRMGLALGRLLGPTATWRVMQTLGEAGTSLRAASTPSIEAGKVPVATIPNLSRGQFMKGVGGAALAMSILAGTGGVAQAAVGSAGVEASDSQKSTARRIVQSSSRYKSLVQRYGSALSLDDAKVKVQKGGTFAHVIAGSRVNESKNPKNAVALLFVVDLKDKAARFDRYVTYYVNNTKNTKEYEVTSYENGRFVARRKSRQTSGRDAASTPNARMPNTEQPQDRRTARKYGANGYYCGGYDFGDCVDDRTAFCYYSTEGFCQFLNNYARGQLAISAFIACDVLYPDKETGCAGAANNSCYADYCSYGCCY